MEKPPAVVAISSNEGELGWLQPVTVKLASQQCRTRLCCGRYWRSVVAALRRYHPSQHRSDIAHN